MWSLCCPSKVAAATVLSGAVEVALKRRLLVEQLAEKVSGISPQGSSDFDELDDIYAPLSSFNTTNEGTWPF